MPKLREHKDLGTKEHLAILVIIEQSIRSHTSALLLLDHGSYQVFNCNAVLTFCIAGFSSSDSPKPRSETSALPLRVVSLPAADL